MNSPLDHLIQQLSRLPGIGEKTATRLAFYLLRSKKEFPQTLAKTILEAIEKIRFCEICQNLTAETPCSLCLDPSRDKNIILVVEGPQEMRAIETGKNYKGTYHVLHGALSPLDRIGPQDLRIKELLDRLHSDAIQEIILATNANVEGETTALYLTKLIKPLGIRMSRIAMGIPVGGDLEYLDTMTLQKAIEGRREI